MSEIRQDDDEDQFMSGDCLVVSPRDLAVSQHNVNQSTLFPVEQSPCDLRKNAFTAEM